VGTNTLSLNVKKKVKKQPLLLEKVWNRFLFNLSVRSELEKKAQELKKT
jgi:hypothetical protein